MIRLMIFALLSAWIVGDEAAAQMPDPRPNAVFSVSRDDVMQFIESRIGSGTAEALLAVHQRAVARHVEEAAAAQQRYEAFEAKRKESGGGFGPEQTRDYGRLLCEWQQRRRAVIVEFEHAGATVLDQSEVAVWTSQIAAWRRMRVMMEIDWSQRMESMADLLVALERIKVSPAELKAVADVKSRYESEMDSALRAWEQRIDLLWREFYENEFDNRDDAEKRSARWRALMEQQQALEQGVQDVNRRFLPEFQSHLSGEHAMALAEAVNARDLPHLFSPTVVDALHALLREHGRLTADHIALLDGMHQAYVAQRGGLRLQMIAAHRKWMEPRWTQQRMAAREEAIAAERSPLDSMRGHPGLSVLRALEDLEFTTIRWLRETFTPEQIVRLPEGVQMLLTLG